jgi:high-affinity iron transporter
MFLDAVILILQEILEAALLLSVLLAVNQQLGQHFAGTRKLTLRWYGAAIVSGILGAAVFAWAMPSVSAWFDYVGQEVTNALMHVIVIACLYLHCLLLQSKVQQKAQCDLGIGLALIVVITLSITREGAEIFLYLNGIMSTPTAVMPALLGCSVAGGIGVSAGILLYYLLIGFSRKVTLRIGLVLLALFAGNMAAQAILLLTQADWLPYTPQLWDSSILLTEYSVTGQLLYALVGYEATPSLAQAIGYVAAMLLLTSTPLFRRSWRSQPAQRETPQ